jgi:hypothetical protein
MNRSSEYSRMASPSVRQYKLCFKISEFINSERSTNLMEITGEHIRIYAAAYAPEPFLFWARVESRTYGKVLSENPEWVIWLADNPTTPEGVLSFLKKNADSKVRILIALNGNASAKVLAYLSVDENENVRAAVAENPNCPIKNLELLSKDKDENVRMTAQVYLGTPVCA